MTTCADVDVDAFGFVNDGDLIGAVFFFAVSSFVFLFVLMTVYSVGFGPVLQFFELVVVLEVLMFDVRCWTCLSSLRY